MNQESIVPGRDATRRIEALATFDNDDSLVRLLQRKLPHTREPKTTKFKSRK